jgi:hypothetical protein
VRPGKQIDQFEVVGVAERLAPYETSEPHVVADGDTIEPELVERAATLLAVMPANQLRETIERLLAPNDLDRGRRAIDALIDAAFAIEDETGHIRKVA